jgi:membrane-associated progesterone receptor component
VSFNYSYHLQTNDLCEIILRSYHVFAGKDATRALAIGSTQEKDVIGDKTGLSVPQQMKLDDWLDTLEAKYPIIARLEPAKKSKL